MKSKSELDKFYEFLKEEYINISNAHFETIKQISVFFRYYLIIISAPIILISAFSSLELFTEVFKEGNSDISSLLLYALNLIFFILSIVGLCLCAYIINLRLDAILYARTINGIRRYIFSKNNIDLFTESQIRVLPINTHIPKYHEKRLFWPVILTFAILDALYLFLGLIVIYKSEIFNAPFIIYFITLIFVLAHFYLYYYYSNYREFSYLKFHNIGIDIDGVLNDHKKHFCNLLKELTGKSLKPEEITRVPVSDIPDKDITEKDEHTVFNYKFYWTDMPPIPDFEFEKKLKKLRKSFGFKIFIFTQRPWPNYSRIPKEELKTPKFNIRKITKKWLKTNNIPFQKLIIEKGNTDISERSFKSGKRRRLLIKNRFQISRKKQIKYFVEDDLIKARKLANICNLVFLIDQPYNQSRDLPKNILRVNDWQEIYDTIKILS